MYKLTLFHTYILSILLAARGEDGDGQLPLITEENISSLVVSRAIVRVRVNEKCMKEPCTAKNPHFCFWQHSLVGVPLPAPPTHFLSNGLQSSVTAMHIPSFSTMGPNTHTHALPLMTHSMPSDYSSSSSHSLLHQQQYYSAHLVPEFAVPSVYAPIHQVPSFYAPLQAGGGTVNHLVVGPSNSSNNGVGNIITASSSHSPPQYRTQTQAHTQPSRHVLHHNHRSKRTFPAAGGLREAPSSQQPEHIDGSVLQESGIEDTDSILQERALQTLTETEISHSTTTAAAARTTISNANANPADAIALFGPASTSNDDS